MTPYLPCPGIDIEIILCTIGQASKYTFILGVKIHIYSGGQKVIVLLKLFLSRETFFRLSRTPYFRFLEGYQAQTLWLLMQIKLQKSSGGGGEDQKINMLLNYFCLGKCAIFDYFQHFLTGFNNLWQAETYIKGPY